MYISAAALAVGMGLLLPNSHASSLFELDSYKTTFTTKRGVDVVTLQDTNDVDSVSFAVGSRKDNLPEGIRRILSLDGGGIRGLYEIAILAVLEEIILKNDPESRISDYFDVAGGTSTGSILAAGLFYEGSDAVKYSAIDLLKLYARYGYEIFDDYKNPLGGAYGAKYSSAGVDKLLVKHFGADNFQNTVLDKNNEPKHLYVIGFDADEQKPAVFSTISLSNPQEASYRYDTKTLVEAIGVSTAAPVYFEARSITKGRKNAQMKDGGLVANNPSHLIYQEEETSYAGDDKQGATYEIYSFGTGVTPIATGDNNRGFAGVGMLIKDVFGAQVSASERSCYNEVITPRSPVNYFARLQPQLDEGMGEMDDTSDAYVKYAIDKAFKVVQGEVFSNMLTQLGLETPENFDDLFYSVRHKLYSLSADNYEGLDDLEQRWLLQEMLKLNFDLFQHANFEGHTLSDEATQSILKSAISELAAKEELANQNIELLKKLKNMFFVPESQKFSEIIKRGLEFHKKSILQPEVTEDLEISEDFAQNLFENFRLVCKKGDGELYDYPKHNSEYIADMAKVYWKDVLRGTEEKDVKTFLVELHSQLYAKANANYNQKLYIPRLYNYTPSFIAETVHPSRDFVVVGVLAQYIKNRYPEAKLDV